MRFIDSRHVGFGCYNVARRKETMMMERVTRILDCSASRGSGRVRLITLCCRLACRYAIPVFLCLEMVFKAFVGPVRPKASFIIWQVQATGNAQHLPTVRTPQALPCRTILPLRHLNGVVAPGAMGISGAQL